jgi:MYXO-CTERM domain-containing protein
VAGAAAVLALVGLGIVFVRRRRRPRGDPSPVSTVVAAASTLRTWLPRPVAEAVEESPWEAAAVVAMLPLLVYVGLLLIQA